MSHLVKNVGARFFESGPCLKCQVSTIRKVKMATAILIVFNTPECGHSNGVFEKQQYLHSQKLRTVVGQKYHPEWYFLMRPAQMI
jgi:hypothetical protein